MSRMEKLKAKAIRENPERRITFEQESKILKIAVMVFNLRTQHRLSQQAFADRVGVPKSTIVRIENAQVNTSIEMLERIANSFDKELEISFV